MRRRLLLAALLLLLAAGLFRLLLGVLGLPPPGMFLSHGPAYAPKPTGRTRTDALGMEFVEISGGCFRMGSEAACDHGNLIGRLSATLGLELGSPPVHFESSCGECPAEWVEIERPFWIGRREVSRKQWIAAGTAPDAALSWRTAQELCRRLSEREPGTYRLPTEVEWECAALAGGGVRGEPAAPYTFTSSGGRTAPHDWGSRPPRARTNAWGIHGMEGGKDEICAESLPRPAHRIYWQGAGAASWISRYGDVVDERGRFWVPVRSCALGRTDGNRFRLSRYLFLPGESSPMAGVRLVWIPD